MESSSREHVAHLGGFTFWNHVRIEFVGQEYSFDAIKHKILYKMGEPRIQLDFFNDPRKFQIARDRETVRLSNIHDGFEEDFGGTDRKKLDFAARYVRSEEDRAFLGHDDSREPPRLRLGHQRKEEAMNASVLDVLGVLLVAAYGLVVALLAGYGLNSLWLLARFLHHRRHAQREARDLPQVPADPPAVLVQVGIDLDVSAREAFRFIADPEQLPKWTSAFASVESGRAVLRTPRGEIRIELDVRASSESGTIDWQMRFPDGRVSTAFSRVVEIGEGRSIYSFVLTPPPAPLEQLEGALEAQSRTLATELGNLKRILERHG